MGQKYPEENYKGQKASVGVGSSGTIMCYRLIISLSLFKVQVPEDTEEIKKIERGDDALYCTVIYWGDVVLYLQYR